MGYVWMTHRMLEWLVQIHGRTWTSSTYHLQMKWPNQPLFELAINSIQTLSNALTKHPAIVSRVSSQLCTNPIWLHIAIQGASVETSCKWAIQMGRKRDAACADANICANDDMDVMGRMNLSQFHLDHLTLGMEKRGVPVEDGWRSIRSLLTLLGAWNQWSLARKSIHIPMYLYPSISHQCTLCLWILSKSTI